MTIPVKTWPNFGSSNRKIERDDVSNELGQAFDEVLDELDRASIYRPMASAHEGYAVILEELDELWAYVKRKQATHGALKTEMRYEACQVAAMAVRFMLDVCADDSTEKADEGTETDDSLVHGSEDTETEMDE